MQTYTRGARNFSVELPHALIRAQLTTAGRVTNIGGLERYERPGSWESFLLGAVQAEDKERGSDCGT